MMVKRMTWRAIWGCLALALLLAPMLGFMHGVAHGPGGARTAAVLHAHSADALAHDHSYVHVSHQAGGGGWLADLFSAHADESDCRVYDQLCHSGVAATPPALLLPMVLPSFIFHFFEGDVLARWAALFEARGPPLTR